MEKFIDTGIFLSSNLIKTTFLTTNPGAVYEINIPGKNRQDIVQQYKKITTESPIGYSL